MRSNGTPRRASRSTRRAISTASRPSPGAENSSTSSSGSAGRRHRCGEQVAADAVETGVARRDRAGVGGRQRHERLERRARRRPGSSPARPGARAMSALNERAFGRVGDRHVEQQEAAAPAYARLPVRRPPRWRCAERPRGRPRKRPGTARRSARTDPPDRGPSPAATRARAMRDARRRPAPRASRERARKPRHSRDRREVGQRAVAVRVEQRARRHRLDTERRGRPTGAARASSGAASRAANCVRLKR